MELSSKASTESGEVWFVGSLDAHKLQQHDSTLLPILYNMAPKPRSSTPDGGFPCRFVALIPKQFPTHEQVVLLSPCHI